MPGVFEDDEDADDEDEIADDLGDRVLERAVQAALDEEAVEQKTLRPRREPKNADEQRDQQKDLNQAEVEAEHRRGPEQRNARGVDGVDGEKNERGNAQDRGDDRDEIRVEFEAGEKAADHLALESPGDEEPKSEEPGEGHQAEERNVVPAHVEKGPLQQGEVHRFSLGGSRCCATGNSWRDDRCVVPKLQGRDSARPSNKKRGRSRVLWKFYRARSVAATALTASPRCI